MSLPDNLSELTDPELRQLKRDRGLAQRVLRDEMLTIQATQDVLQNARHKAAYATAAAAPNAVMAEIEAVAAAADSSGLTPQ